jgi:ABC-type polysaccharide/polyol phosphate export permease
MVIPLSIIFSNFIHLIVALLIFIIPILTLHTLKFVGVLYILMSLVLLMLFTIGLSLLTSALNVRYRDINFFVQALLTIWFYLNPIVYTLSMIPYKYYWFWRLNPITSILQFLQHGFLNKPLPGVAMILSNTFITLAIFFIGIYVFERESKYFDDWL